MNEVSESIIPRNYINRKHLLLAPHLQHLNIENLEYHHLSKDMIPQLEEAVRGFPAENQPVIHPETMPHYQASVVTPKEAATDNTVGLIYIPGASSMASSYAHVAAELFDSMKENLTLSPNLTAALSSSGGMDTLGKKFPYDVVERAAYQAAFIVDLLRKQAEKGYTCQNLYLAAHSLGGMEVNYVLPILTELLKGSQLETEVRGLLLVQPAGIIDQPLNEPIRGVKTFMSLDRGIREMWPTPMDINTVEEQIMEAKAKGDPSEEFRLKMLLREMGEKYKHPQHLTDEEKTKLKEVDDALAHTYLNKKERKRLLKERYQLLSPALNRISGTDIPGYGSPKKNLQAMYSTIRPALGVQMKKLPTILREWRIDVTKPRPRWLRQKVKIPIGFIWGSGDLGDVFFPAEKAQNRMVLHKLKEMEQLRGNQGKNEIDYARLTREASYFPNSPLILEAEVKNWPHEALISNTEKFSSILINMIERMHQKYQESTSEGISIKQEKLRLHY